MMNPPVVFLDQQDAWDDAAARHLLTCKELAVDLESNGYHRYPERVCLLQLGLPERVFILDTLAVRDLHDLGNILGDESIRKVFHACDNDLRALQRDFGFRTRGLFDTAMAASFLGARRLGLANILKQFLALEIPKRRSVQRQDWSVRPITPEALDYAATDVLHLLTLQRVLAERLQALGRRDWVEEECRRLERIDYTPPAPPEEHFWQLKGVRALTPRQRAIARELYLMRDQLAREFDRPPFRIMPDDVVRQLAQKPRMSLKSIKSIHYALRTRKLPVLKQALQRGEKAPAVEMPARTLETTPRCNAAARKRLEALKTWRNRKGQELDLDPALLWPLRNLENMALRPDGADRTLFNRDDVRAWQRHEFSGEIMALMQTFKNPEAGYGVQ